MDSESSNAWDCTWLHQDTCNLLLVAVAGRRWKKTRGRHWEPKINRSNMHASWAAAHPKVARWCISVCASNTLSNHLPFALGSHGQVFEETPPWQLESCMGVLLPKGKPKKSLLLANKRQQITSQQPNVISQTWTLTTTPSFWCCHATVF